VVSYILIAGYSRPLFCYLYEPIGLYFVAVILKVLLVNLPAALNFAKVFFLNKKRLENKKTQTLKKVKT